MYGCRDRLSKSTYMKSKIQLYVPNICNISRWVDSVFVNIQTCCFYSLLSVGEEKNIIPSSFIRGGKTSLQFHFCISEVA